jgi:hypothetical protein
MITIKHISIAGKTLPIKKNKPRCFDHLELEAYRWELWADYCRCRKIAFDAEESHNKVLFTYIQN